VVERFDADLVEAKPGSYDHSQSLTIDPLLSYSSFLGGNGTDEGNAIAVDSSGNESAPSSVQIPNMVVC